MNASHGMAATATCNKMRGLTAVGQVIIAPSVRCTKRTALNATNQRQNGR